RTAKERSIGVEVIDPEGKHPLSLTQATTAENFQLSRAGFYELRLANGRRDMVGVNPDRRESDLSLISDEALSLWKGTGNQQAQQAAAGTASAPQSVPYGIWWYIMLLAILAAVAESAFSSQYLGTQREAP